MYVGWDECEFGAPCIDPKRPYGNGDGVQDIAEILGIETPKSFEQMDEDGTLDTWYEEMHPKLYTLHRQTLQALQIVLCTGSFEPGLYRRARRYDARSWERVDA
jgi:hypothetical protein